MRKNLADEIRILEEERNKRIYELLEGRKLESDLIFRAHRRRQRFVDARDARRHGHRRAQADRGQRRARRRHRDRRPRTGH